MFQFVWPDGTDESARFNPELSFDELRAQEGWKYPECAFFNEANRLIGGASKLNTCRQTRITVQLVYDFRCVLWDEPRYQAFPGDWTLKDVCVHMTKKESCRVSYKGVQRELTAALSTLKYEHGSPILISLACEIQIFLPNEEMVRVDFPEWARVQDVRQYFYKTYPGYKGDIIFHAGEKVLQDAEFIYRVIGSDVIRVTASDHRTYQFRDADGKLFPHQVAFDQTVEDVFSMLKDGDDLHTFQIYLNENGDLPRNAVFVEHIPGDQVVIFKKLLLEYELTYNGKVVRFPLPDEATLAHLRDESRNRLFGRPNIDDERISFHRGDETIKEDEARPRLLDHYDELRSLSVQLAGTRYEFWEAEVHEALVYRLPEENTVRGLFAHLTDVFKCHIGLKTKEGAVKLDRKSDENLLDRGIRSFSLRRRGFRFQLKLAGHDEMVRIRLSVEDSNVGAFKRRLRISPGNRHRLELEDAEIPDNPLKSRRIRVSVGTKRLMDAMSFPEGHRDSKDETIEVCILNPQFSFCFKEKEQKKRIDSAVRILKVEQDMSENLKEHVAFDLPCEIELKAPRSELTMDEFADGTRIQLVASLRPLYTFSLQGLAEPSIRYVRFRHNSSIGEVKTLVCWEFPPDEINLFFRTNGPLPDDAILDRIVSTNWTEQIRVEKNPNITVTLADAEGKHYSIEVSREARDRKEELSKKARDLHLDREYVLDFTGQDPSKWHEVRNPRVDIRYLTFPYRFRRSGREETRFFRKNATAAEVCAELGEDHTHVLFVVNGVPCLVADSGRTIGTTPSRSVIDVIQLKGDLLPGTAISTTATVGDARKIFQKDATQPDRRRYFGGPRRKQTLVNSDYLFKYAPIHVKDPREPGPPQNFDFQLPGGEVRSYQFDYWHRIADVSLLIEDVIGRPRDSFSLTYSGHLLTDSDFIHDIGYREGFIEVSQRVRMPMESCVMVVGIDRRTKKMVPIARLDVPPEVLQDQSKELFGVEAREFVYFGRILNENCPFKLSEIGPLSHGTLYVCQQYFYPNADRPLIVSYEDRKYSISGYATTLTCSRILESLREKIKYVQDNDMALIVEGDDPYLLEEDAIKPESLDSDQLRAIVVDESDLPQSRTALEHSGLVRPEDFQVFVRCGRDLSVLHNTLEKRKRSAFGD
jgi:hypothetical protein